MGRRERPELPLAFSSEADSHDPVVVGIGDPFDEAPLRGAVHQLHRTVVTEQEVLGDIAHARRTRMAPHSQEQLVLGGGEARYLRRIIAPPEEPAQPVAEIQQGFEVVGVEVRADNIAGICVGSREWRHIVRRFYRIAMDSSQTPRRMTFLSLVAAGLGLAGGAAAWILLHLIAAITNLAVFGRFGFHPPSFATLSPSPRIVIVAVAGALIISLLAKWAPVIKGHGIPEAMEAVLTKQSRIAPRTAIAKPLSAAVAIGSSAPFGAEGPIIVTGGAIGSLTGQLLRVSPSERKILLACGAAAGMAATFGAPLAAVVLAVELLLFEFSARALIPLVVATSVAGGVHAALYGSGPLFSVPSHGYSGLGALPAFALLGLAAGLLGVVITRGLFLVESLYRRLPIGEFWHPVIGAVAFASVGLIEPRALGVGYDAIDDVLNSRLALVTVVVLGLVKLVAWWLALGSGTSGGTLAPILLISASAGTLIGAGLNHVVPGAHVSPGTFAVVAMAATFGASTRATFTAIVFVFELTRDYQIILPLMLATVIADLVFSALSDDSIMTEKLTRRGLRIGRHYGVDPMATTRVDAIMTTDVVTLPSDLTIGQAHERFLAGRHGAYPVLRADEMIGIVARRDVLGEDLDPASALLTVVTTEVIGVKPDDHALDVLHLMVDEHIEHVPVLDDSRLVGICTLTDLLKVRRQQRHLETRQPGLIGPRPDDGSEVSGHGDRGAPKPNEA